MIRTRSVCDISWSSVCPTNLSWDQGGTNNLTQELEHGCNPIIDFLEGQGLAVSIEGARQMPIDQIGWIGAFWHLSRVSDFLPRLVHFHGKAIGGEVLGVPDRVAWGLGSSPNRDSQSRRLQCSGDRFVVTTLACNKTDVRLGLCICFDFVMPESIRCLRALGAELVACPLACNTARLDTPPNRANNEMVARCRAAENEVFLAVVNHSGRFNGGSFLVGPSGECVTQLGADAAVEVVDLPVGRVRFIHRTKPYSWLGWGYRQPDVYRSTLGF